VAPECRGAYCDNDPIVLAHSAARLKGTAEGAVDYVHADVRETDAILGRAGKVLDLDRPVALSVIALLHLLSEEDGAGDVVDRFTSRLAPGSYVVLSSFTSDFHSAEPAREGEDMCKAGGLTLAPRTRERFTRFVAGLDLVEPGIVLAERWHPELEEPVPGQESVPVSATYAGVARKAQVPAGPVPRSGGARFSSAAPW
jgi:hypothetical protein